MAAGDETRKLGQKAGSKARPKAKARRGPTTLGQSIEQVTNRTMARRGFNEASIATRWPEIVGRPLCDHCRPFRIVFPRGERRGGTLHLTVTGAFAPEVTHLSPQIIERINGYFGYGAVDRLELHHGTVAPSAAAPPKKSGKGTDTPPPPDGALAATLAKVEDPDLRAALGRLVTAHTTSRPNDD
jgi:hypothetical protein